ncbi:hypothetical protein BHM03_00061239 [Ensete ventricosum]|nr:hypothetical protein BHM03_00061239 [Ensete ventricosum]
MDGSLVPRRWGWLLEWRSSGQEEAPQVGSGAGSYKEVGAYIVGGVGHPYQATLLPLWLTMPSYTSTTPAVLVVRHASAGKGVDLTCVRSVVRPLGIRPYLCQVGRTVAGTPYVHPTSFPRRVGHVGGPVVRGREDVAARSSFAISIPNSVSVDSIYR